MLRRLIIFLPAYWLLLSNRSQIITSKMVRFCGRLIFIVQCVLEEGKKVPIWWTILWPLELCKPLEPIQVTISRYKLIKRLRYLPWTCLNKTNGWTALGALMPPTWSYLKDTRLLLVPSWKTREDRSLYDKRWRCQAMFELS